MDKKIQLITVISGEHSGDIYAADLIKSFKKKYPNALFNGISGASARQEGLEQWPHCHPKNVMGIWNILGHLLHYRTLLQRIELHLKERQPDLLILIDYAGLNLRVAKIAHKLNIKILYYIPPKVWAWGKRRLEKIFNFCTLVAPLYPFEYDFFKKNNCPVTLVKHPFIAKIPKAPREQHSPYVALLPGSRRQEITSCLPVMLRACRLLLRSHPDLRFKILCADSSILALIHETIDACGLSIPLQVVTEAQTRTLQAARAVIVCSGTAAFECGMLSIPMVVVYRCHWLTYWIAKIVVRLRWYSLPNLILQRPAIVELIQSQCCPENIAHETSKILPDSPERNDQLAALLSMQKNITDHPHSYAVEDIVFRMIQHT